MPFSLIVFPHAVLNCAYMWIRKAQMPWVGISCWLLHRRSQVAFRSLKVYSSKTHTSSAGQRTPCSLLLHWVSTVTKAEGLSHFSGMQYSLCLPPKGETMPSIANSYLASAQSTRTFHCWTLFQKSVDFFAPKYLVHLWASVHYRRKLIWWWRCVFPFLYSDHGSVFG